MEMLRKAALVLGTIAFAVCSLFLNGLGGAAILTVAGEQYRAVGIMLLVSSGLFLVCLVTAYGRKLWANIVSLAANAAATVLYILPISALNSIADSDIPRENIEKLTSRIYPSVAVTVLLAVAVLADIMTERRITEREKRREERIAEKRRALHDDEKIV